MSKSPRNLGQFLLSGIIIAAFFGLFVSVFSDHLPLTTNYLPLAKASDITSTLTSGNSIPSISSIVVNGGNNITLNPNATTTITVSFQVTDYNGCSNVFSSGTVTSTLHRSGVSSTGNFDYRSRYIVGTSSIVNSCSGTSTTANATATFQLWYFADATDASSSFSSENWKAYIQVKDGSASSSATTSASGVEINTLLALNLASSSISYGSLAQGQNTSSTNQQMEVFNVGNASHTINLSGTALTSGSNSMPTSSQHFASGTFTYGGGEQQLSATPAALSGVIVVPAPGGISSWSTTTPLPIGGTPKSLVYNSFIYTIGGSFTGSLAGTSSVFYAPIYSNNNIGSWQNIQSLPFSVSGNSIAAYNGYMYSIGGSANGAYTSTIIFSAINTSGTIGSWQQATAAPFKISNSMAVVNNNYMYVVGGYSSSSNTSTVIYAPINTSGTLGAWQQTQSLPVATSSHHAFSFNGYMYVLGGSSFGTSTVIYAPINTSGTLGAWQQTQSLPYPIASMMAGVYYNYVYVAGGVGADGGPVGTSTVIYAPILSSGAIGTWNRIQSLPTTIRSHSGVIYNGFIYTVGGDDDGGYISTVYKNRLFGRKTFWGLSVSSTIPTGTYQSTITVTAVYSP